MLPHARTTGQIAIVHKWADLPPPTIWNNMLNDRIESHNLTIFESARISAYLNTAMYIALYHVGIQSILIGLLDLIKEYSIRHLLL